MNRRFSHPVDDNSKGNETQQFANDSCESNLNKLENPSDLDDARSESVESQGLLNADVMSRAIRTSIDPFFIGQSEDSNVTNLTSASNSEETLRREYPKKDQNDKLFYLNNGEERGFCIMEMEERKLKLAENANILRANYSIAKEASKTEPNARSTLNIASSQVTLNVDPHKQNQMKKIGQSRLISDKEKSPLLIQKEQKHYQGEYCKKTSSSKSQKVRHSRSHAEKRQFTCGICNKSFSDKSSLVTHMRIHTGEKPFSCHICLKRFSQQGNLNTHMRIHVNEKFVCVECGKAYKQKQLYMEHIVVHTGEKRFKCGKCDKSFSTKWYLQQHRKNKGH